MVDSDDTKFWLGTTLSGLCAAVLATPLTAQLLLRLGGGAGWTATWGRPLAIGLALLVGGVVMAGIVSVANRARRRDQLAADDGTNGGDGGI